MSHLMDPFFVVPHGRGPEQSAEQIVNIPAPLIMEEITADVQVTSSVKTTPHKTISAV